MEQEPLVPRNASDQVQNNEGNTISRLSRILCWFVTPALIVVTAAFSSLMAALLPIILLPTLYIFHQWKKVDRLKRPCLDTLIRVYFGSGILGPIIAIPIQSIYCYAIAVILFGAKDAESLLTQMQHQGNMGNNTANATESILFEGNLNINGTTGNGAAEFARHLLHSPKYYVLLLEFAFVSAGLVEEALKYFAVIFVRRYRGQEMQHAPQYIVVAVVAGLGFATFENFGFAYAEVIANKGFSNLTLTLFERVFISSTLHALAAWLTAVQLIRRNLKSQKVNFVQVLWKSVLLHGSFDMGLLSISAWNGKIGWVHPDDPLKIAACAALTVVVLGLLWVAIVRDSKKAQIGLNFGQ